MLILYGTQQHTHTHRIISLSLQQWLLEDQQCYVTLTLHTMLTNVAVFNKRRRMNSMMYYRCSQVVCVC